MRLLPWFTERYHSPLPPAELLLRLQQALARQGKSACNAAQASTFFTGHITANTFFLQPCLSIVKSPVLLLRGQVSVSPEGGSWLYLQYRLTLNTLLFTLVWLGISGLATVLLLRNDWLHDSGDSSFMVPAVLFALGLVLPLLPFWLEASASRPLLLKLLRLRPLPSA